MDQQIKNKLSQFINDFSGKPNVGDTEGNRGQCVGLIQEWLNQFGLPQIWGNAKDLLNNADRNFYTVIGNSPDNFPIPGDILVFDYEPFGHTGVVVNADIKTNTLFEQNNPIGSKPRIVKHSYKNVKGWIRMRDLAVKPVEVPVQPQKDPSIVSLIKEHFRKVNTHGLDPSDLESTKVVYDTWADVALNGKYVLKDAIPQGEISKECQAIRDKLQAFAQLGYNTPEDITKAIQKEREKFTNLSHDQIEVEKKNEALALTLAEDSRNNYTAMEEGLKVVKEKEELVKEKIEIAKALDVAKPSTTNIIDKIFFIQGLASKWRTKLEDDAKKREAAALQSGKPAPKQSATTTAFLSFLKLIPEVTSTKKGGAN